MLFSDNYFGMIDFLELVLHVLNQKPNGSLQILSKNVSTFDHYCRLLK